MELITTVAILKSNIGVHDNLFGGEMMSYLDLAGFSFAVQKAKCIKMVTKKISEVIFHTPVKVNSIVKIYGELIRVGNTSLTIRLEARRVNVENSNEILVCSAEVVFVRVNDNGEPCPLYIPRFQKIIQEFHPADFGPG